MTAMTLRTAAPAVDLTDDGQAVTTSVDVAAFFGKRHKDVLRAIDWLLSADDDPDFNGRNFAPVEYLDEKGEARPMYRLTRDGFTLLAMGFTGPAALRWKKAYIAAFNAMEAKLRGLYVAPLPADREFTRGIRMKDKLVLHEQGRQVARELGNACNAEERRQLYWRLYQINMALGIPMPTMAALGVPPLALPGDVA